MPKAIASPAIEADPQVRNHGRGTDEYGDSWFFFFYQPRLKISNSTKNNQIMAIRSTERAIQTDQDRKSVYVVDKENKVLRRYVDVESFTGRLRVTMNAQPPVDSANQGQKPGQ